jgi:hypothetical protein
MRRVYDYIIEEIHKSWAIGDGVFCEEKKKRRKEERRGEMQKGTL